MRILLFDRNEKADWVKILEEMYDYNMAIGPEYQLIEDDDLENPIFLDHWVKLSTLSERLGMNIDDVEDSIGFLKSSGLVKEYENEHGSSFGLNEEGLRLAHQIKTERQRRNTNIILLALTGILTLLTVILVVIELGYF